MYQLVSCNAGVTLPVKWTTNACLAVYIGALGCRVRGWNVLFGCSCPLLRVSSIVLTGSCLSFHLPGLKDVGYMLVTYRYIV